jgi:hypothetical protein
MWLRDAQARLRATLNPQGLERIFVYPCLLEQRCGYNKMG